MTGIEMIAAERQRQIEVEGWTPEHDNEHRLCEINRAAQAYLQYALKRALTGKHLGAMPAAWWPWSQKWWKPTLDPIGNLVKAGALIAAEIDRLQRLEPTK